VLFCAVPQVDQAEIDIALVGDSVSMVVHGYDTTLPITLDDMLLHCKAVARGAQRAFLVGDLPFGSYELSTTEAVRSAIRMLKEGGMDAVKLEGGQQMLGVGVDAAAGPGCRAVSRKQHVYDAIVHAHTDVVCLQLCRSHLTHLPAEANDLTHVSNKPGMSNPQTHEMPTWCAAPPADCHQVAARRGWMLPRP
jgi:hypothetical protein